MKFADNQGKVAQSERGLQTIMDALGKTGNKYYMKINFKKTKVTRVCTDSYQEVKENEAMRST